MLYEKWFDESGNLFDKILHGSFEGLNTSTHAMKIARTGLWSDNLDSTLSYWICFSPLPNQIIRSHLQNIVHLI